jgi:hypothetical protein
VTDIRDYIVATVGGDAAYRAATGARGDDLRFYWYYQGDSTIDDDYPGYVTYALISSAEPTAAIANPTFSFAIWARYDTTVNTIRDRLVALFHKKTHTTSTGRKLYSKVIQETDAFSSQPNFAGMMLHIRFGWLAIP